MNTDQPTEIQIVDAGRTERFPAPIPAEFDDAAQLGRRSTEALLDWLDPLVRVSPEHLRSVQEGCRIALRASGDQVVGHVRNHDGVDTVIQHGALDANRREAILADGGGLLVAAVERYSNTLNRMCGHLAVAREAPVTAVALFGSEPTRVLGPQVDRTTVLAASSNVIVHPEHGGPFDLSAGAAVTVDGYPRVIADPGSFTLLFLESACSTSAQESLLMDRGLAHPLMRMDAPLEVHSPVEVYGLADEIAYPDLLRQELDQLTLNAPEDLLRWWWLIGHSMEPMRHSGEPNRLVLRGRFPGGVGVIEHDQHLVLRGAGVTFVVPEHRHELMRQLLSAEPIECTVHDDGFQSLANLMDVGAVEVVAEHAPVSETDPASVGNEQDDSAERLKIMVEQAPLEIRLAAGIDPRLAQEIRRSLSGHPASSASPLAWLTVRGSGPFEVSSGVADGVVTPKGATAAPYREPLLVEDADYAVYAVGDWIESASMLHGRPELVRIHASGFVDGDQVWLASGPSNVGKTTLVLEALSRGAGYLSEERITVRPGVAEVEVQGLAQPLRIRGDQGKTFGLVGHRLAHGAGADAFRQLIFCDQLVDGGGVTHDWVTPTDLLVLVEDLPGSVSRGWAVRQLAEQCMNAITTGPNGLLDLARLVCSCRLHVAGARSLTSTLDLTAVPLDPLDSLPAMLPEPPQSVSSVATAPGVRTIMMGEECVLWASGEHPTIVHLEGVGASWWCELQDSGEVPTDGEFSRFITDLRDLGLIVG